MPKIVKSNRDKNLNVTNIQRKISTNNFTDPLINENSQLYLSPKLDRVTEFTSHRARESGL